MRLFLFILKNIPHYFNRTQRQLCRSLNPNKPDQPALNITIITIEQVSQASTPRTRLNAKRMGNLTAVEHTMLRLNNCISKISMGTRYNLLAQLRPPSLCFR